MQYMDHLEALCKQVGASFAAEESLAAHTTFRVGGACRAFVTVPHKDAFVALRRFLAEAELPHHLIGRGSNLIVADKGYDGVVLMLAPEARICRQGENALNAWAGGSLKSLCMAAADAALTGLEFAYGIPGTVGGAVYMNAGAYGGEMSQVVTSVDAVDEKGELCTLSADALELSYRHSCFMRNQMVILGVNVSLTQGDPAVIREKMDELMHKRIDKQPLEYPSAGSTFKRPEGSYASMLIDQCGLKGLTVGGAQVSEKHAGFVINRGGATCDDILRLCAKVRDEVYRQTGYTLELEPELLGIAPSDLL